MLIIEYIYICMYMFPFSNTEREQNALKKNQVLYSRHINRLKNIHIMNY